MAGHKPRRRFHASIPPFDLLPLSLSVRKRSDCREVLVEDGLDLEFPRFVDGKPIIRPEDKTLGLELFHPGIPDLPRKRGYIVFTIPKMMVGNALVY